MQQDADEIRRVPEDESTDLFDRLQNANLYVIILNRRQAEPQILLFGRSTRCNTSWKSTGCTLLGQQPCSVNRVKGVQNRNPY